MIFSSLQIISWGPCWIRTNENRFHPAAVAAAPMALMCGPETGPLELFADILTFPSCGVPTMRTVLQPLKPGDAVNASGECNFIVRQLERRFQRRIKSFHLSEFLRRPGGENLFKDLLPSWNSLRCRLLIKPPSRRYFLHRSNPPQKYQGLAPGSAFDAVWDACPRFPND